MDGFKFHANFQIMTQFYHLGETAFGMYESVMSELVSYFPCDEKKIMEEHQQILEHVIKLFRDETLMDPDVDQFQTYLNDFTVRINS